jgi:hypothetical protein
VTIVARYAHNVVIPQVIVFINTPTWRAVGGLALILFGDTLDIIPSVIWLLNGLLVICVAIYVGVETLVAFHVYAWSGLRIRDAPEHIT